MKIMEMLAGLARKKDKADEEQVEVVPPKQYSRPPLISVDPDGRYTAVIDTSAGIMKVQLLASEAPITVNNFVYLARDGFYEDGQFHRVIRDFMVQGGCPFGTGDGGPGYSFPDEPVSRRYVRGTLAMANAGPNTNGSQFFIVSGGNIGLPPNYTIFGLVTEGLEVLDFLSCAPVTRSRRGEESWPVDRLVINNIEIEYSPKEEEETPVRRVPGPPRTTLLPSKARAGVESEGAKVPSGADASPSTAECEE